MNEIVFLFRVLYSRVVISIIALKYHTSTLLLHCSLFSIRLATRWRPS